MGRNVRYDGNWYVCSKDLRVESHPNEQDAIKARDILNDHEERNGRTREYRVVHDEKHRPTPEELNR